MRIIYDGKARLDGRNEPEGTTKVTQCIFAHNTDYSFQIIESPTANCQMFSVWNLQGLLNNNNYSIQDIKDRIYGFYEKSPKLIMLADIKQSLEEKMAVLCEGLKILVKQRYISTNHSLMTIYLVSFVSPKTIMTWAGIPLPPTMQRETLNPLNPRGMSGTTGTS